MNGSMYLLPLCLLNIAECHAKGDVRILPVRSGSSRRSTQALLAESRPGPSDEVDCDGHLTMSPELSAFLMHGERDQAAAACNSGRFTYYLSWSCVTES